MEMCFSKKNSTLKYEFTINDAPITIGRDKQCKIILDSNIYSKFHCSLSFDDKIKHWILEDGYYGNKSSNGTWLITYLIIRMLLDNKYELTEDSSFKISNCIFKVSVI